MALPKIKKCPFCKEEIKAEATKCPYCGESLGQYLGVPGARPSSLKRELPHPHGWGNIVAYPIHLVWWLLRWGELLLEWLVDKGKRLALFDVLEYATRIVIIITLIAWFVEAKERRLERYSRAMQVIDFAVKTSAGGKPASDALEVLHNAGFELVDYELQGVSLPGLSLNDAVLIGANLRGGNLTGADLRNAYLTYADLRGASLNGADLRGASLSGADLRNTNLSDADLRGASLTGGPFITIPAEISFTHSGPSKTDLREAKLIRADLSEADLSEADLSGANLFGARLVEANLTGANLSGSSLFAADLDNADLVNADLSGAVMSGVGQSAFVARNHDTSLRGANLSSATLIGTDLRETVLSGADLSQAEYNNETLWPEGFDPAAAGAINIDME